MYLKGLEGQMGAKVWIERLPTPDATGRNFAVKLEGGGVDWPQRHEVLAAAEAYPVRLTEGRIIAFAELLALLGA